KPSHPGDAVQCNATRRGATVPRPRQSKPRLHFSDAPPPDLHPKASPWTDRQGLVSINSIQPSQPDRPIPSVKPNGTVALPARPDGPADPIRDKGHENVRNAKTAALPTLRSARPGRAGLRRGVRLYARILPRMGQSRRLGGGLREE